jgi:hypothetical protein
MSKNDGMILESILKRRKVLELSEKENFEVFAFDQILKDYDLSDEELFNGKIEDTGIGLFNFVNDELINEDSDLKDIKKANMKTFLIIAKQSYSEIYIDVIIKIINEIFDFRGGQSDTKIFRDTYLRILPRELMIHIIIVTKEIQASNIILQHIEHLTKIVTEYIENANIISRLVYAGELIMLSYKEKSYTLKLKYDRILPDGRDAYFVLATLDDYGQFVANEEGKLRRYIFDFNIRDFQKISEVNEGIEKTLRTAGKIDFWWANNGIAILATKSAIEGNYIILDNVQVVNGLQTTHVLHKYLKTIKIKDPRRIGIKIITTVDEEVKDIIIEAANSQNPILKTSLRANDNIQRNIESYLLSHDWFYDRRKNYYKNLGKPSSRIISIAYLAQAIISMVHREPNRARKNPSTLTKDDKDYDLIFGLPNYKIFLFCINNMKKIDIFIRNSDFGEQYKTNLKWHLATLAVVKLLDKKDYKVEDIESILDINFENSLINQTMLELIKFTDEYLKSHNVIFRTMSSSKEFTNYILENVKIESNNLYYGS